VATDTFVASGLLVGTPTGTVTKSWKNNVPQIPSQQYCISAYTAGTTTPLIAGWPNLNSDEHTDTNCTGNLFGGSNLNLYILDLGISPATTSVILGVPDTNG
jgi:hypothetical protein